MLADRVRIGGKKGEVYLAQDSDFIFDDWEFVYVYVGNELEIEIPHIIHGGFIDNYNYMFAGGSGASPVTKVVSRNGDVTSMVSTFRGSSMSSLNLSNFNTSNVYDMNSMFAQCFTLKTLDLSGFDTSNVYGMNSMFAQCPSLSSLNLSNFNTSNVQTMDFMFTQCSSLTSLDLSNFNTSNVMSMYNMFAQCSTLKTLDLSSFDTSNVYDMDDMFNGCTSITTAYARTQADADRFNASSGKPAGLTFIVKP